LDDSTTRLSAQEDPLGLIREKKALIIDEVQSAPQLILAIKKVVDEYRQPGRFLLTGSASLLVLPSLSDSLAGRKESFSLLPLSQSEILGMPGSWIDSVFAGNFPKVRNPKIGSDLIELILIGGFPEALTREKPDRVGIKDEWIKKAVQEPLTEVIQQDGRIRRWVWIPEVEKYLRVIVLDDGETIHNAFFDRRYKEPNP
jgi:predicted AAA+ superfamily ATPase